MRVIITRPEPACSRTAELLESRGHETIRLPLFAALHLPDQAAMALAANGSGLVVTSAEAARVLAQCPDATARWKHLPVHAVGAATGRAMAALGFSDVRSASGSGANLGEAIAAGDGATDLPLIYLAGEPRSPGLEGALSEAGRSVAATTIYRMVPEPLAAERLKVLPIEGELAVLLYSREAALRFSGLMAADGGGRPKQVPQALCLSAAIAEALPLAWQAKAAIAPEPSEEALLALLPSP